MPSFPEVQQLQGDGMSLGVQGGGMEFCFHEKVGGLKVLNEKENK